MQVEKLPIKREWEFYDDDSVTITFSMSSAGVNIPLAGTTPFSQIRLGPDHTSTLVSTGICTIADDIITINYAKEDLASLVGETLYGDLRLLTLDSKTITLLSFSATINPTISRQELPT